MISLQMPTEELGASCAKIGHGGDPWFPTTGGDRGKAAKAVCATCPLTEDICLIWSLHHEDHGVWAGLDKNARDRERRRRGIKLVPPEDISGYAPKYTAE